VKRTIRPAKTIFLKLEGKKVSPKSFTGSELATIIINLESSLRAVAKNQNPELDESELYISLVDVVHQSAGLKFIPSYRHVAAAFIFIASTIQESSYEQLPVRAITGLKEIQRVISHKDDCVGTFISGRTKIAQLTKSTDIQISTVENIEGETILYGRIQRIGGSDPKVVLKLHTGELLSLDVTEDVARKFGARLYTEVGLSGTAIWSPKDYKLLSFRVKSLTPFEDKPIDTAFQELRGVIGKYWDEIDDIEEALLIA
jgi:hypothetical protein